MFHGLVVPRLPWHTLRPLKMLPKGYSMAGRPHKMYITLSRDIAAISVCMNIEISAIIRTRDTKFGLQVPV